MRLLGPIIVLLSGAAASAAEPLLTVYVASPGINVAERDAAIGAELEGLPFTIVTRDRMSMTLSTNEAGYERLSSQERFREVRIVAGAEPARQAAERPATDYIVKLRRPDSAARYTASLTERRPGSSTGGRERSARHGEIAIEGLNLQGDVLTRAAVNDPRIIRFEAVGRDGHLTGRREFLRAAADLSFTLADDPRVVRIRLSAMDSAGLWQTIGEVAP